MNLFRRSRDILLGGRQEPQFSRTIQNPRIQRRNSPDSVFAIGASAPIHPRVGLNAARPDSGLSGRVCIF